MKLAHTCMRTHNRLTALCLSLPRWAGTRRNILDFTEARDDGVAVASSGPYARLHLAPEKKQPCQYLTRCYYRPDALPATQRTVSKLWLQVINKPFGNASDQACMYAWMHRCLQSHLLDRQMHRKIDRQCLLNNLVKWQLTSTSHKSGPNRAVMQ